MTRLADLTWPEAGGRGEEGAVLLVPVGATEQHGPHLPVTTDTDIAVAVVEAAAARDPLLVVAPVVNTSSTSTNRRCPTAEPGRTAKAFRIFVARAARVKCVWVVVAEIRFNNLSASGMPAAKLSRRANR